MGTHLRVLCEGYPMSTNMTGLDGWQKNLCVLVHWAKVAPASEGLKSMKLHQAIHALTSIVVWQIIAKKGKFSFKISHDFKIFTGVIDHQDGQGMHGIKLIMTSKKANFHSKFLQIPHDFKIYTGVTDHQDGQGMHWIELIMISIMITRIPWLEQRPRPWPCRCRKSQGDLQSSGLQPGLHAGGKQDLKPFSPEISSYNYILVLWYFWA